MGTITRFADLHCHPHMRSYNWLHNHRKPEENSSYNPWWIILPKRRSEAKGNRGAAYTQCDLAKVINGNLKLAFVSLYPLETGWVKGRQDSTAEVARNLGKYIGDNILNEFLSVLLNIIIRFIGNDKRGALAGRDFLQAIYMKIPLRRINFVQSRRYDYFKELIEEKKFLGKQDDTITGTRLYIPLYKRFFINKRKKLKKEGSNLAANGTYVIARNGKHIRQIINDDKTAFVLTIEGANVLNSHEDIDSIREKIDIIKSWDPPLFFITFTHHFNNYLAGHAHSIPDIGSLFMDQSAGLKSGFTSKGLEVLRMLLSFDENNNYCPERLGHRILIDVKHLNAVSRKEYYAGFVLPSIGTKDPIPVIASHVAYSGKEKLQDLIDGMDYETDNKFTERNGHKFNNWNINLCDEDVINIFRSKGLIGINLDQRVLGISKEDIGLNDTHASYVWQNIKGMMLAVIRSKGTEISSRKGLTDLFCLGTDFDGFIDPLNSYSTVMKFEQLGEDLIKVINNDPDKGKLLRNMKVRNFVRKFCFSNAYNFALKNFK